LIVTLAKEKIALFGERASKDQAEFKSSRRLQLGRRGGIATHTTHKGESHLKNVAAKKIQTEGGKGPALRTSAEKVGSQLIQTRTSQGKRGVEPEGDPPSSGPGSEETGNRL